MDPRKAFDTVTHNVLMHKLYHYGIREPAFDLIVSYLPSRFQFVGVNDLNSNFRHVNIEVPQVSILGPLLFHEYVSDLHYSTTTSSRLFADDTCLVLKSPSITFLTQICNSKLHNLKSWCDTNYNFHVNPFKSVFLVILFKQIEPIHEMQLFHNEFAIVNKDVCKYLGVIIDKKLNFKAFFNHVESKIAKSVGTPSRLGYLFPSSTLLLLYSTLIQPHLL